MIALDYCVPEQVICYAEPVRRTRLVLRSVVVVDSLGTSLQRGESADFSQAGELAAPIAFFPAPIRAFRDTVSKRY